MLESETLLKQITTTQKQIAEYEQLIQLTNKQRIEHEVYIKININNEYSNQNNSIQKIKQFFKNNSYYALQLGYEGLLRDKITYNTNLPKPISTFLDKFFQVLVFKDNNQLDKIVELFQKCEINTIEMVFSNTFVEITPDKKHLGLIPYIKNTDNLKIPKFILEAKDYTTKSDKEIKNSYMDIFASKCLFSYTHYGLIEYREKNILSYSAKYFYTRQQLKTHTQKHEQVIIKLDKYNTLLSELKEQDNDLKDKNNLLINKIRESEFKILQNEKEKDWNIKEYQEVTKRNNQDIKKLAAFKIETKKNKRLNISYEKEYVYLVLKIKDIKERLDFEKRNLNEQESIERQSLHELNKLRQKLIQVELIKKNCKEKITTLETEKEKITQKIANIKDNIQTRQKENIKLQEEIKQIETQLQTKLEIQKQQLNYIIKN